MSEIAAIFGLSIIVGTICVLVEMNRKSALTGILKTNDVPMGYDEPTNNLGDPTNVRTAFNRNNPVVSKDTGPFGIERCMRSTGQGNHLYPTYGYVLSEY